MKSKIKYIFLFLLLFFNLNYLSSQNDYYGLWNLPISIPIEPEDLNNPQKVDSEKHYKLIFNQNGFVDGMELSTYSEDTEEYPIISGGGYLLNGTTDFHIYGDRLYYNGELTNWRNGDASNFSTEVQIISTIGNELNEYDIIYSWYNAQKDYDTELYITHISTEDNTLTIGNHNLILGTQTQIGQHGTAFSISNLNEDQDERKLYVCIEDHGVYVTSLYENGEYDEMDLIYSEDNTDFSLSSFNAYNMELKDGNYNNPTLAWISIPEENDDGKIYMIYDESDYTIDLNLGILGGIEFSALDDHILYVSTEDEGIIALDWQESIASELAVIVEEYSPETDDYSRTFLQKAPDGNIYGVSDDGTKLCQISMSPTNNPRLFNPECFNFNLDDLGYTCGTYRYFDINDEYLKYYILPENEQPIINIDVQASNILCDHTTSIASIYVRGGIPPYDIVVKRGTTDVSDLFTWDEDYGCFRGTQLIAGIYEYTITDSGTTGENGIEGEFSITEGDAYDFEEDLLEINQETAANINGLSDLVWDENDVSPQKGFLLDNTIMFKHGFRLDNNTVLTINNLRLEFDEDFLAKVIIEPGSKLVLNNCTLTNYHCSDDPKKWAGIEVWGNSGLVQTDANQGRIELDNTIIEHAHEAVQLWKPGIFQKTGGKIYAENSTFRNNRRALVIMSYVWEHPAEEILFYYDYNSIIENCTFENNDDYINDNGFYSFVSMYNVKGVKFRGCTFNSGGHNAVGIDAIDAGFYIRGICNENGGCTDEQWQKTYFYNFDKAIYARNSGSNAFYPINIMHSYFENNNHGAYLYNLHDVLKLNTSVFVVGNNGDTKEKAICGEFFGRGIHIEESNGFEIESNEFVNNTAVELDDDVIGVLAKDNPSNHDIIFNNKFTGLKIGNRAYGFNRYENDQGASDPWGLEYQCNQNTDNAIDFEVVGDQGTADARIRENIGYTNISARNTFTSTSYEGLEWHWRNMGWEQENYYLHISEENTNMEPHDDYIQRSDDIGTLFTKVTPSDININQCPDGSGIQMERTTLNPEEIEELEIEFAIAYQDYEAVESIYNDLTDGGSTEGTSLTIESAQPDDTWELRNNLLGKSPYLSREVLEKAANKTEVLPNSVLLDILAANPDELKKEDFIRFLENKEEPLPDYMISILREISVGTTYKTALLNQMGLHKRKQLNAANSIIKSLINSEEQNIEAIKGWLANRENLQSDLQIAGILIKESNYSTANDLLNTIPEIYNIEGDALDLYLDDKYILSLKMNLLQENRTLSQLNSAEIAQLETIADNESGMAKAAARIILEAFYGYDEYCDCMTEEDNKSSITSSLKTQEESPLKIEATPNPATHYVEFYYELSEIDKDGVISISDINGKIIQIFNIKLIKGIQAWDTRNIPSGSYIYTLKTKYFEQSGKLIIQ